MGLRLSKAIGKKIFFTLGKSSILSYHFQLSTKASLTLNKKKSLHKRMKLPGCLKKRPL